MDLTTKHAQLASNPQLSQMFKDGKANLHSAFTNEKVGKGSPFIIAKTRNDKNLLRSDRLHAMKVTYPMFVPCYSETKTRMPFAGPDMGHNRNESDRPVHFTDTLVRFANEITTVILCDNIEMSSDAFALENCFKLRGNGLVCLEPMDWSRRTQRYRRSTYEPLCGRSFLSRTPRSANDRSDVAKPLLHGRSCAGVYFAREVARILPGVESFDGRVSC